MALKFYLHQIDAQHEIHCDTNSTFTEVAGSFDIGTFVLEWNATKYALFPNTKLFIVDTEIPKTWSFIVSQDNVEVVKKTSSVKYLHTLTVTQNTKELNYHIIRNSNFQQPFNSTKTISKTCLFGTRVNYQDGVKVYWENYGKMDFDNKYQDSTFLKNNYVNTINNRTKIKSGYATIKVDFTWYNELIHERTADPYKLSGQQTNLGNESVEIVGLSLVNADDENDKLLLSHDLRLGSTFLLNQTTLNWLVGKRFYIKFREGNLSSDVYDALSLSITGIQNAYFHQIMGFATVEFHLETYTYSLWDVLDILNKQCKKIYNDASFPDIYIMPDKTSGKGLILDQTIAPEFNFTGLDLFSAVAQVMSFIDAFPTLDENGILSFEYLNDLSNEEIQDLKANDVKTTLNEQNFSNRLVANYQNAKQNNAITYPAKNHFKKMGSTTYGVISDRNNYWFILDKPIDYIDEFLIKVSNTHFEFFLYFNIDSSIIYQFSFYIGENVMNIENSIFENSIYNQLPNDFAESSYPNKNNTLYYTKGDNKIYAGAYGQITLSAGNQEVFTYAVSMLVQYKYGCKLDTNASVYLTHENKPNIHFNCTYHAIFDGRVSQESTVNKFDGETTVAQENSGIELNRMGNNMQGLIAKLGTELKSVNLPITKLANRVNVGSLWQDDNGDKWYVNSIKTTFTTNQDKVIVDATFTKNFNMLQQFTKLNQEKRFYEISRSLTNKGYENITEYLYFTNRPLTTIPYTTIALQEDALKIILMKTLISNSIVKGNNNYDTTLSVVYVGAKSFISDASSVVTFVPNHLYGSGNSICIEMGYEDSINAGDSVVEENNKTINRTNLYTKDDGFADLFNIIGYSASNQITTLSDSYPTYTGFGAGFSLLSISNYQYYKKPNEIFHLNYSLAFMPYWTKTTDELGTPIYNYDEIFFGDSFINNNGLIPNNKYEFFDEKEIRLWVSNEKYSIVDNKAFGTDLGIKKVLITFNNDKKSGNIEIVENNNDPIDISNYKSWCIADREGNIYIACNYRNGDYTNPKLTFFTSRFRKV